MSRVLIAMLIALVTVELSGCTGSLRLGSQIPVVANESTTANV